VRSRLTLLALAGLALCLPSASAEAAKPANPCLVPAKRKLLRCPDLQMSKPFGLRLDPFAHPGHVLLRAGNSVNNLGAGPAELFGVRSGRDTMRARQRIYRRRGGRIGISTGAHLFFKAIPGQGHYWKFLHAAQFDLYRLDFRGRRIKHVRRGPKVSYCLRDLFHTHPEKARSPGRRVYPGCNQSARTLKVRLGTSVGWSDVYPPTYNEQWIDVTGLRGCFAYVQTADPRDGVYESNERNNSSSVTVRLPFRPGNQHCPSSGKTSPDTSNPGGGY
jgi:hypothetical protein